MTEKPIDLDEHRGMGAQKATELRRLLADVDADAKALRLRQEELEANLIALPASNWREAAEKAVYLLKLFAASFDAQDPRRQKLIASVLNDFERTRAGIGRTEFAKVPRVIINFCRRRLLGCSAWRSIESFSGRLDRQIASLKALKERIADKKRDTATGYDACRRPCRRPCQPGALSLRPRRAGRRRSDHITKDHFFRENV